MLNYYRSVRARAAPRRPRDDVDRSRSAIADRPDCVVICTDHAVFSYDALLTSGVLIVDTRNALKDRRSDKIFRL